MNSIVKFNEETGLSEFVYPTLLESLPEELPVNFPEGCELVTDTQDNEVFFEKENGVVNAISFEDWSSKQKLNMELSVLKSDCIEGLRKDCTDHICQTYPYYKQLNIIRESGDDLTDMGAWIDEIRGRFQEFKDQVEGMTEATDVLSFEVEW